MGNLIIKWFFVVLFLIISVLFGFGIFEATNGIVAVLYLIFAYLAYKTEVTISKKTN